MILTAKHPILPKKPDFDSGLHEILIRAEPQQIFQAIEQLQVPDVPIMRSLFAIRSIPSMIVGKGSFFAKEEGATILQGMEKQGFRIIRKTKKELVFGIMGKPWKASNPEIYIPEDVSEYELDPPKGMLKAMGDFQIGERVGERYKLLHTTQVFTPDKKVKRKFTPYWFLIFPGAYLLRWAWLRAIKQKAEALATSIS
ncbi:MAG: hypothetical protein AAF694_22565 [Bacteroidota bacterium]